MLNRKINEFCSNKLHFYIRKADIQMRLTDKPRTVNREKVKLPIEKINFTFQEIFKMSPYQGHFLYS